MCGTVNGVSYDSVRLKNPRELPPRARAAHTPRAMASNVGLMRLKKELKMLYEDPPPGISAWAQEENFHEIEAGAAHMPLGNLRAGSHC